MASCKLVVLAFFCNSYHQEIKCKNPFFLTSQLYLLLLEFLLDINNSILTLTTFTFLSYINFLWQEHPLSISEHIMLEPESGAFFCSTFCPTCLCSAFLVLLLKLKGSDQVPSVLSPLCLKAFAFVIPFVRYNSSPENLITHDLTSSWNLFKCDIIR